jgi:hypothetical protein
VPVNVKQSAVERSPYPRWRRAAWMAAGVFILGLVVAACGDSPSTPSAAKRSTTTTGAGSAPGGGAKGSGLLAYSSCMRSHGVPDYPDPAATGGIPKAAAVSAIQAVSSATSQAAQNACEHFAAGESLSGQQIQTITTQQQQDYLNAAACMRTHGLPAFPEPVFSNGHVEFPMLQHLVDLNSPEFKAAYQSCKKLIPPGLPYSGSSG